MSRQNISSNTPWETLYGYSRAVRIGNVVEVAGTVAADENGKVVGANAYEQAKFIFTKIEKALAEAGASLQDVVRTRMFLTDVAFIDEVGRAHGEVFRDIRPASTALQISALINPELLVEIEVTAILQ
ncbi:MAG TPA: RidA family protein [Anaerolineales bacterium]|nr:RidA family protein [Anaerolineales bacterium]